MNERQLRWELERERFRIPDPAPPPERRPEKPIGEILSSMLTPPDPDEAVHLPDIVSERWPLITGGQLAQHTRPAYLKSGILYIYADHPGWLAEMRRIPKIPLIRKLSILPGLPVIKDIRFQLDPSIQTRRK